MKIQDTIKVEPEVPRSADGWRAVLYFENGGRQVFSSLYWTSDAAMRAAKSALSIRIKYAAQLAHKDPPANQTVEI